MNRLSGPLLVLTLLFILLGTAVLARAQDAMPGSMPRSMPGSIPGGPPAGSLSLSQIILKIEGQPDFGFVQQVTWQSSPGQSNGGEAGSYRIAYRTKTGELRLVQADARTGMPHPLSGDGIPKDGVLPPPAQMPPEKTEPRK